jgi:RNA polymerase-binding protein DksA
MQADAEGAIVNTSMEDRRTQLLQERQQVQERIAQIQGNERQETSNGQTDTAHEWENADVREDLLSAAEQQLRQVDAALHRIDTGTYGLCEICGEPIAEKRLDALPLATRCIECADS